MGFARALIVLACLLPCVAAKPRETVVIVSMDGMAWQILNASIAPNLDRVAKEGVWAKYIKTVTPTKTWPIHHSCLTGLFPESHGIVSNEFWDPVYKETFIFEYDCSNRDPKFYSAAEPIWLTLQNRGGRSGLYFWPGGHGYTEKPTFYEKDLCLVNCSAIDPKDLQSMRNKTREKYPPYIHCWPDFSAHPFKSRVDKVMGWLQSDEPPNFVALYIDEPDWKGHRFGPMSSEFREAVEMVDGVVGYFIRRLEEAKLLDKVNLMFVSDHSFHTTSSDRQIYLEDYLDPEAYRLTESGTLGHLWPAEGKLNEIYDNLTRSKNPHMTVFKKEDIPESLHWKHNRRIPPIFINPALGWEVQQSRPANETSWTGGNHGWPAQEALYAVFFARGPAFRRGVEVAPFNVVDLYPLMAHLLGIKPRPNNGSLDNVAAMLTNPPGSTRAPTTNGLRNGPSGSVLVEILLVCLSSWFAWMTV